MFQVLLFRLHIYSNPWEWDRLTTTQGWQREELHILYMTYIMENSDQLEIRKLPKITSIWCYFSCRGNIFGFSSLFIVSCFLWDFRVPGQIVSFTSIFSNTWIDRETTMVKHNQQSYRKKVTLQKLEAIWNTKKWIQVSILLMEEILHHLGFIKNSVDNEINYLNSTGLQVFFRQQYFN